jgi:hypothetical protein
LRGNDGFEDREGHQAPFTLRISENALKNPSDQGAIAFVELNVWYRAAVLFCFLDGFNDLVEIRPLAGLEFGMEQFAIDANFESAAARWNQRERFNALAEFEYFGRQTDGLRRVVSNDAVFD